MEEDSSISKVGVAINLDRITLARDSHIGRGNWITGLSTRASTPYFRHITGLSVLLLLGEGARITKLHHFDCSHAITIGRFVTIAGYGSQFLNHSIDLQENRQSCAPICIGGYCFVGTRVVVLGGSALPSHSVLGACALLNRAWEEPWSLYGGVPDRRRAAIPYEARYFPRPDGFVI